jgi:hypothetical protein
MSTSKQKKRVEWEKNTINSVVGSLNQMTDCILHLNIGNAFQGKDIEGVIATLLENGIFGLENSACASGCEPKSSVASFRMNSDGMLEIHPLPLGEVAFVKTPDTRSTSHPANVSPSKWLSALRRLPLHRICAKIVALGEIESVCGADMNCGSSQCPTKNSGENWWREYKMCNTLGLITKNIVEKYLKDSFLACIHAVQIDHSAQLFVGIDDSNHAVLGIDTGDSKDFTAIKTAFSQAICSFFAYIFPPVPCECIKLIIHEAIGSVPTDWDGDYCYQCKLTVSQAREALSYFVGRCFIEKCEHEDHEQDCMLVSVEASTYKVVCKWLFDEDYETIDSEAISAAACANISNVRASGNFVEPEYLKGWERIEISDQFELGLQRRVVVCIEVSLPPDVSHCACIDPCLDSSSSDSIFSYASHRQDGILRCEIMSPFQIWLRAKGLRDGAVKSNLYTVLRDQHALRVMVLRDEDKALQTYVQSSLYQYANMQHIDCVFWEDESLQESLKYLKHRDVLLVTVWSSRQSALRAAMLLKDLNCTYETLIFTWVHDAIPLQQLFSHSVMQIRDVAVLISDDTNSEECDKPSLGNFTHILECVPPALTLSKDENETLFRQWVYGEIALPWALLDASVIPLRKAVYDIVELLKNDKEKSIETTNFRIHKKYPGSGGSSTLMAVGWMIERTVVGTHVYIAKRSLTTDCWECIRRLVQPGAWVLILVDEDVAQFDDGMSTIHSLPFKVTVVRIVLFGKQSHFLIDPILSFSELRTLSGRIATFPLLSNRALDNLVHYADQHRNEEEIRHIYVVMFTALKGQFIPPRTFFERQLKLMDEDDKRIVLFLAFISQYLDAWRHISTKSASYESLSANALELTSLRQGKIGFLHPYLANLYTEVAVNCDLEKIWTNFEEMMETVAMTQSDFRQFYRSLLVHEKGKQFTALQTHVINYSPKYDLTLIEKVFLSSGVTKHCGAFSIIACSRVLRALDYLERSVELARSAYDVLQYDSTHSNLARNNYGKSLGCYGVAYQNVDAMNQMRALFAVSHAHHSQIQKFEEQFSDVAANRNSTYRAHE